MRRFGWAVLGVLAAVDCGGSGGGTGPVPGSIAISAGNNQVAAAGSVLPESLAVLVKDAGGAPLAGVNVSFSITAGGGSVSPASRATNASGIAKTQRTLGPNAGTQTVNATAGSLAPAQFSAVSQISGAVNIANSTAGPLTDTVGTVRAESLAVLVTDQNATPISGITVNWSSAGGAVSPTSSVTGATGVAKTRFTYGTVAGNQPASATVTGLVGSPVQIALNATAGAAVTIVKVAGDNGSAGPGGAANYTVQSRDSHANASGGVTIDWAVGTGGGSISPPQNTTGSNGNATAIRTLGSGFGSQTATATANGLAGTPSVTFATNVTATVQVADFSFTPTTLTVPLNTTVTWEWQGTTAPHTVTFDPMTGKPTDIAQKTSGSDTRQFTTAGTFTYHCSIHPVMTGTITVTP